MKSSLPPIPDDNTGEPRPPQAPALPGSPDDAETTASGNGFSTRRGLSPALETYRPSRKGNVLIAATVTAILFGAVCALMGGFDWIEWESWWLWVPILWPAPTYLWQEARTVMTAGSRWLISGRRQIDTYDLCEVRVEPFGHQYRIVLFDSKKRGIAAYTRHIQGNPRLWDLVYNGILHSAHTRPMKTNHLARKELKLGTADLLPPDPGDTSPRRLPTFRERHTENRRRAKRDRPEII